MWTEEVLEKTHGKTIDKVEYSYVGDNLYLIKFIFKDGSSIIIDNEHKQEKSLQAKFV